MQNDLIDRRERDGGLDEQARTNVVIVYDTAEMGRRAMRALRGAIECAREGEPAVELRLWRLDLLAESESGEMANSDIQKADMLFLAIESADSLPSAMDSWLQQLTRKEEGIRGLALLVGDDEPEIDGPTRLAFRGLRSRAEASHIDFMTNVSGLHGASKGQHALLDSRFVRRTPAVFDDFAYTKSSRGWGIND